MKVSLCTDITVLFGFFVILLYYNCPLGINVIKRKAAAQFNPKLSISVGNGCVKVVRKMPIKEITNEFKLDDEIDVNDDDHKYKVGIVRRQSPLHIDLTVIILN